MMKSLKAGFTLAEVLVTLMVIGVVAAMTIPTLMTNTGDKQDQVAAKKVASVLSQGVQLLVAKEISCSVSASNSAADNSAALTACLLNVVSGSRDASATNIINTNDGMKFYFYAPATASGNAWNGITSCGSGAMGSSQVAWHGAGNCGVVVDVNGTNKGTKSHTFAAVGDFTAENGFSVNPQAGTDIVAFSLSADSVRPLFYGDGADPAYKAIYGTTPAASTVYGKNVVCMKNGSTAVTGGCGSKDCLNEDNLYYSADGSCTGSDTALPSGSLVCGTCTYMIP